MNVRCCRYGAGDKVEAWLNELLCLNASEHVPKVPPKLPLPGDCDLFYVERDTLFSFHKVLHPASPPPCMCHVDFILSPMSMQGASVSATCACNDVCTWGSMVGRKGSAHHTHAWNVPHHLI